MNARHGSLLIILLFFFFQGLSQTKVAGDISNILQTKTLQKTDQQFFIENKGQWDAEILYMTSFAGLNAFITKKGIVYDFYELKELKSEKKEIRSAKSTEAEPTQMEKYGHMIRINLLAANEKTAFAGKEKSKTYYNYLSANDTAHSYSYVGLYKEVAPTKVYDKIDMRYYFEGNSLRYDFILKPGANSSQIKMQIEGADSSYINTSGEWVFETRFGEVRNTKLLSYQIVDGEKKVIRSKFKKDAKGNITFELGAYDDTKELVIDPLVYSTLIGSFTNEYGGAITLDDSSNVYIAGSTNPFLWNGPCCAYPKTPGAYNQMFWNTREAIVLSKFSPDLSTLLYSTYFTSMGGGADLLKYAHSHSISLGTDKSIHIVGDANDNSGAKAFYVHLTADGSSVISAHIGYWDQYYPVYYSSVTVDHSNNYIISGAATYILALPAFPYYLPFFTAINPPPLISDSLCRDYYAYNRAFIAKYDANNNLVFLNFFGEYAICTSTTVDSSGNVYATGQLTQSHPNYPFLNSYDSTYNGQGDAFLAKFNPNGVVLSLSYLGGTGDEYATSVQIDKLGNVYVLGHTNSTDFPTTVGCVNNTNSGNYDIFISKFDPTGDSLLYSTYFGGSGADISTQLQVDTNGNMYFSGYTASTNLPTSIGCHDDTYNGGLGDVFVSKLSAVGDSVLYLTYLGGSSDEIYYTTYGSYAKILGGLALDKHGDVYTTGTTLSADFPTTAASFSQTPYGGFDIFVSKIKPSVICDIDITISTSPYSAYLTQSQTYIRTSGTVIVDSGSYVKFDAEPTSYVQMNPGFLANSTSVFIAQAFNGCSAGAPQLKAYKNDHSQTVSGLANGIFVYPNPTTGNITIEFPPELTKAALFDMMGKKLMEIDLSGAGSRYDLDMSRLSNGVYTLYAKGYTNTKIIKN